MTISLAVLNVVLILSILMVAMTVPHYMNSANGPLPQGIIFKEPKLCRYLTGNASSKTRMFYAFYEAIEPNMSIAQTPIILWLQGGPGCSSMTGNFYELGPWKISSDLTLYRNRSPWNRKFGVLFIDSPAGSGYNIVEKDEDIPTNENQVAEHLYIALKELYNSLPEFSNRLLFVAGESYAGKYVLALGHYILMKSKKNSTDNEELGSLGYGGSKLPFGLGGLLIGNGLTDPEIQVQTFLIDVVLAVYRILGNRWSLIAGRLPGRTDNEIKNYWNTHLSKTGNVKDRSTSLSPVKSRVFKPTPRKVRTTERTAESKRGCSNMSPVTLTSSLLYVYTRRPSSCMTCSCVVL